MDIEGYKQYIYKQANLFTTKDTITNKSDKNITLISGYSGSGKSTLGEQLEQQSKNNIFIELDGFEHGYDTTNSHGVVSRFIKKHGLVNGKNCSDMMPEIWEHIENEANNNPDKHYYVDGVQLLGNADLFKEYPSIIKGTGGIKSSIRRFNRDDGNSENIINSFKYNFGLGKRINEAKKMTKQADLNPDVKLYPHQQRAADKPGDSIIMAHAVGSGKTLSAIARMEKMRGEGRAGKALVVVPAGLRSNFADSGVKKFTNSKVNIVGNGTEIGKKTYGGIDPNADYNVISYEMFRRNPEKYIQESGADTLINDESHKAKNEGTATTNSLKNNRKYFKNYIGLTGSVISNSTADVQPLVDIASGGQHNLGKSKNDFSKYFIDRSRDPEYRGMDEKRKPMIGFKHKKQLQAELAKYIDYVDVDDVKKFAKMPDKKISREEVPITAEQAKLYRNLIKHNPAMKKLVTMKRLETMKDEEAAKSFSDLIEARKLMNSVGSVVPGMSLKKSLEHSPKTEKLLDDLEEHLKITPDGQAILMSHLINGGTDVLEEGLKEKHIDYGTFTGKGNKGVTEESRQHNVDEYNKGKKKVMIISSAGGEGLSLNDTTWEGVLDGHYNPEKMKQMEARGIRSGGLSKRAPGNREVQVHRYVATMPKTFGIFKSQYKTPDEIIYEIANNKDEQNQHLFNLLKENNKKYSKQKVMPPSIEPPVIEDKNERYR